MDMNALFEEMQGRLSALLKETPAHDIEQNVRSLLQQGFAKLELATREELELQSALLARARQRLEELEARVAALEGAGKTDRAGSAGGG